jgi:hypothetical protein
MQEGYEVLSAQVTSVTPRSLVVEKQALVVMLLRIGFSLNTHVFQSSAAHSLQLLENMPLHVFLHIHRPI